MSFWRDVFTDIDGSFSFKRVQTAVFGLLFVMVFSMNLFTGKTVSDNLLQLLSFMITWGYTGIAVEKFTKRGITPINEPPDPPKTP